MSALELAIEKVKKLDEAHAVRLIEWLDAQQRSPTEPKKPLGARAMLGFATRSRAEAPRATAEWIAELREGDSG